AEGHLVRARAAQALRDGSRVSHGGAATARAAAEDAAADRRARAAALSRARSLAHGEADPRDVDGGATQPEHAHSQARRGLARDRRRSSAVAGSFAPKAQASGADPAA